MELVLMYRGEVLMSVLMLLTIPLVLLAGSVRLVAPLSWIHIDDYSLPRSTIAMYVATMPALVAGVLFETRVFQFGWFIFRQMIAIIGTNLRGKDTPVADLDLDIRAAGRGHRSAFSRRTMASWSRILSHLSNSWNQATSCPTSMCIMTPT
jgi:hypothetical protein